MCFLFCVFWFFFWKKIWKLSDFLKICGKIWKSGKITVCLKKSKKTILFQKSGEPAWAKPKRTFPCKYQWILFFFEKIENMWKNLKIWKNDGFPQKIKKKQFFFKNLGNQLGQSPNTPFPVNTNEFLFFLKKIENCLIFWKYVEKFENLEKSRFALKNQKSIFFKNLGNQPGQGPNPPFPVNTNYFFWKKMKIVWFSENMWKKPKHTFPCKYQWIFVFF